MTTVIKIIKICIAKCLFIINLFKKKPIVILLNSKIIKLFILSYHLIHNKIISKLCQTNNNIAQCPLDFKIH